MGRKTSISRKVFVVFNVIFMLFMIIICLYPLIYVLFASLSNSHRLMAHGNMFLMYPIEPTLAAYKAVISNPVIWSGYLNTLFVVAVGIILGLVMTALGAYFLSRRDVMLRNAVMGFIVFTMFFSGGLIPLFLVVRGLGLLNSIWALILPSAMGAYNLIIMRTSFMSIPAELEEAAIIDGAGHIRILTSVVLPLSKSVIAVMILFYGVTNWNAWFHAAMFLTQRELFPLQLVLREILIQHDVSAMTTGVAVVDGLAVSESVKYAVIIVATLPILMIYPFLQRYFVKGVMIGALKG